MSARVCVLTPETRGAVAVVRVWGMDALKLADAVFRPARGGPLSSSPRGAIRFGRAGAGLGDEVVAVAIDDVEGAPPEVELHCHGGPAPSALVVDAFTAAGATRARPEAWLRRHARSRSTAQAFADLSRAATLRAAEILLEQAQGALAHEVARVISTIDDASAATARIDMLLARSAVGLRLIRGWSVVLAGRPNVGKSRLLNALAGYERAIVDPTPGTTRDVVTLRTAFDGWPVELADTAGLRSSSDPLEAAGISRARARQAEADLTLLVLDRSEPLSDDDAYLINSHNYGILVVNKTDLLPCWSEDELASFDVVTVSAQTGAGLDDLAQRIAERLVPIPPAPGSGVPFRKAQVRRLLAARTALGAGDAAPAVALLSWFVAGR